MLVRPSCRRLPVCLAILATLAGPIRAATPLATEFQINSFTPAYQYYPSASSAANGAFVVVWTANLAHDGNNRGIFGQRFDSSGGKLGAEFQVNSYTTLSQSYAKVAAEPDGDFIVVWQSFLQDNFLAGVFAQRYDSAGTQRGSEFQVNSHTFWGQYYPAAAVDGDGDFVVVWSSGGGQDGNGYGIFGQRFDSSGAKVAVEFQVNTYTTGTQRTAAIAMEGNGDFVVIWDSPNDADQSFGVRGQRFDSAGMKLGAEFAVNTYTLGGQYGAGVGMDGDGDFAVAWTSAVQDAASSPGIFSQRYDSSGAKQGVEFQVNSFTVGAQYTPAFFLPFAPGGVVAMDADGDFVICWTSSLQDTSMAGAFGQQFDSSGSAVGEEFQINTYFTGSQAFPNAAMDADGDFVVAWHDGGQDGSNQGVFGRRFAFGGGGGITLDVDGNGEVGALTDGLLLLRWMFGFSGTTLTAGATGTGCTRCDGTTIASYIDSIASQLDVDDNSGEPDPLTDGLLILRRLFGFTGATLTTGALGNGCMRCDAGDIADYIDGLSM